MNSSVSEIIEKTKLVARDVWNRRWVGAAVAWPVGIVCALLVSATSDRYEAGARVYVDTQTVLKPLMAGLAVQPDMDQQVKMLARTLVSRPNVERLMDTPALGLAPADPADRETRLAVLMSKIKIEPTGSGNLYAISYRDTEPQRAKHLVESLVELFMSSTSKGQKRDSEEAGRFINEQIKSHEAKLVEAENRLKDFKLKNFGVSGVATQDYFARMSTLSEQVSKLDIDLRAAQQARDTYRRELASESPQLPLDALSAVPVVRSDTELRLSATRSQVDDLLRRFTEEHPDVLSARRTIASLEQQKRREDEARSRSDGDRSRSAATSPVYQRIRISLAQAEADVASIRSNLSAQQVRLGEIRATANRVPQVEAELAQLNRDYDVIRKNYDALVSRRESASMGLKLDESSQLADFRLVEPPRVSPVPVAPRRAYLAIGAVLVTLLAGAGAAFAASKLRPTVGDIKTLAQLSGRQVLGTVSMFVSDDASRARRIDTFKFAGLASSLLLLQAAWVAWISLAHRV